MIWLIPVCLVAVCAASGSRKRASTGNMRRPYRGPGHPKFNRIDRTPLYSPDRWPIECSPLPWLPERIDAAIAKCIVSGLTDRDLILQIVLSVVYPETMEGCPILWPCQAADCSELKAIEEQTRIRIHRRLAEQLEFRSERILGLE